jgi:negative regulator of flagellin synthesis FlgM
MKIDKPIKPLPVSPAGSSGVRPSPEKPAGNQVAATNTASGNSTDVHLGTTASQLSSMESSMSNTPVVDAAKVAQIKQAISEGRFQVNSGVVADRLIQSVTDLIKSNGYSS